MGMKNAQLTAGFRWPPAACRPQHTCPTQTVLKGQHAVQRGTHLRTGQSHIPAHHAASARQEQVVRPLTAWARAHQHEDGKPKAGGDGQNLEDTH